MGKIIKLPFVKKEVHSQQNTNTKVKPSLDEQFHIISQQSQEHLQRGSLGLYACDLYSLSEINRKEQDYNRQIHSLIISAYIHLSGIDDLQSYSYWRNGDFSVTEPMPLLPPAIIRSTKTCMKRLNLSTEQYRELYLKIVEPTLTPTHVFGIKKSLDIICTYLDGNEEKADKMVASGTKKFKKELSAKGR